MESVEANGITIDTEKRLVTYKAQVYSLPKKEYKLLRLLMSKPGRVFTREEILAFSMGDGYHCGRSHHRRAYPQTSRKIQP